MFITNMGLAPRKNNQKHHPRARCLVIQNLKTKMKNGKQSRNDLKPKKNKKR